MARTLPLAGRGQDVNDVLGDIPTRAEVESAGGVYTEVPEFGEGALTASTAGAPGQPPTCVLVIPAPSGAQQRMLSVAVAGGTAPPAELCDAAAAIARMPG